MRVTTLLTIAFLGIILFATGSLAAWQSTTATLGPGNIELVGTYNVKVETVDTLNERVNIRVSHPEHSFTGTIQETTTVGDIRITPESYEQTSRGPRVSLRLDKRVDARFTGINFPQRLNKHGVYRTYATVRNNGTHTATYTMRMRGDNVHIKATNSDTNLRYEGNPRKVQSSVEQSIELEPGERRRLYFAVQPSQDSGKARIRYSVASESTTLDEWNYSAPIVRDATGYIEKLQVAANPYAGETSEVTVHIRNAGITSSPYYVSLSSPSLQIQESTKRVELHDTGTDTARFTIQPYGGGTLSLTATLTRDRRDVDTLREHVSVGGADVYRIEDIAVPSRMVAGEQYVVPVRLRNTGSQGKDVAIRFESDVFTMSSPQRVVRLAPQSTETVELTIAADRDVSQGSFTVHLVDQPSGIGERRFTERKTITSQTKRVNLYSEPSDEPADEVNETTVNTTEPDQTDRTDAENDTEPSPADPIPEPDIGTNTSDTPPSEPPMTENSFLERYQQYWPYLVIAILLLIIIFLGVKRYKR